jgi:hypothetical protein
VNFHIAKLDGVGFAVDVGADSAAQDGIVRIADGRRQIRHESLVFEARALVFLVASIMHAGMHAGGERLTKVRSLERCP